MSKNRVSGPCASAELNEAWFDAQSASEFVERSPHLKHRQLRERCLVMANESFQRVSAPNKEISVLDMGAGEGMLTLPYLEMGARVTAVDATAQLLDHLEKKAARYHDRLTMITGNIFEALEQFQGQNLRFDIICASSFLHHIPDYMRLCRLCVRLLTESGVLFTFQDPLRYDTLPATTLVFDRLSYFWWRCFQGDYLRGVKTRFRRLRGVYRADLPEDVAEFHVVRNGVDQQAIQEHLSADGLKCEIRSYWSTHSGLCQSVGEWLNLTNTFGVMAQRRHETA